MKISFLVTYYNQEQYVYDSLNSLFKIKKPCDYEVIVGNDGSTDDTLDEVNKWKDKFEDRISVYTADRNDGVVDGVVRASNLRRELYKQSTGDYFCILDGDDYYCDMNFLLEAMEIFEKYNEISVVMFNYRLAYHDRIEENKAKTPSGILNNRKYITDYYSPAAACVLKAFRDEDYMTRLMSAVYYDDNDIVICNLGCGDLFYVDKYVFDYRQSPQSAWNSLNRLEKGLLNVLGAENENFLAPKYSEEIFFLLGFHLK